jgi:hypothetical protein
MIRILAKGHLQEKRGFTSWQASLFIGFFLALFFLDHCRPSEFLLAPLPSKIDRMEGYASIRITGDEGTVRSKFSFLFQLPHQGRIEVSHTFGRTFYQIIINEEKAALVLPSKKIYWQGEEDEIINKFLGFRLSLDEMIGLLSGKWRERQMGMDYEESREGWSFEKDKEGRITAGQRGDFQFEIREFFKKTSFARQLFFWHPLSRSRLKVLSINFNRPVKKKDLFSLSFLKKYKQKSWAEIEKILADEN